MLIVLMNLPLHLMVNAGAGSSTAQAPQEKQESLIKKKLNPLPDIQDTGKPSTNKSSKQTSSQKTQEKQESLIKKQSNPLPEIQEKTELLMDLPSHLMVNAGGWLSTAQDTQEQQEPLIKKQLNKKTNDRYAEKSSINYDNESGNPNRQDGSDESGSDCSSRDDSGSHDSGSHDSGSDCSSRDDSGSHDSGSDDSGSHDSGSDCSSRDDSGSDDSGSHEFDKQIAHTDYFNEQRNTASEKVLRTNGIASTAQNGEKIIYSEGHKLSHVEKIQNEDYEVSEEKSVMVIQMSTKLIHPDKNIGPNKIIDSLVSSTNTEMRYQKRKHEDTQSFQHNPLESVSSSKQLKSKTEPKPKEQYEILAARLDRAIKGNAEQKNNIQGAREDKKTPSERRRIRAEKKAKKNKQEETVSWVSLLCCCFKKDTSSEKSKPSSKPSSKKSKSRKKTNNNRDSIDPKSANAILLTIKMKNQEQEIDQKTTNITYYNQEQESTQKTTNITDYNQEQESGQRVSDPNGAVYPTELIRTQRQMLLESMD